ncbi:MAG: hypothetical protein DHS20C14_17410 [Phycisphaeraceae bacterium]|nr:MAG: hypothetical protein DHS20C14_17410 [Phycisphaeraceae bacterium]
MPRRRLFIFTALALTAAIPALLLTNGCSSPIPSRDPTGLAFPAVTGESLEKVATELPAALGGRPAVVLVGYQQNTQFDIDRWLMGLIQAGAGEHAQLMEVPTIPGLVPTMASGWIDDGMRSGIPREDWGSVVTLYGKAAKPVAELTGTDRGRLARVLVLDGTGEIVWFDDAGYSATKAMAVADLVERLSGESGG